jgi:quercetin dioxygenase-like cupin family protein
MDDMTWIHMTPTVRRRATATGDKLYQMLVELQKGSHLPEHRHPHEQVVHVVSGRITLIVKGEPHELGPRQSFLLPGDVPHAVDVIEDSVVVDTFSPPREDLIAQDRAQAK